MTKNQIKSILMKKIVIPVITLLSFDVTKSSNSSFDVTESSNYQQNYNAILCCNVFYIYSFFSKQHYNVECYKNKLFIHTYKCNTCKHTYIHTYIHTIMHILHNL